MASALYVRRIGQLSPSIIQVKQQKENYKPDGKEFEWKSLLLFVCSTVDEYCSHSTLHGVKYIRDKCLPTLDRIFWFVVFILSLTMSTLVIAAVWHNWCENPFLILYDTNVTPVWEVPFPSITICTYFMIKKSFIDLETSNNSKYQYFANQVCTTQTTNTNTSFKVNEEEFFSFLKNATPSCSELMRNCKWKGVNVDCCSLFIPSVTDAGLCHTFNTLPSHIMFRNNNKTNFDKSIDKSTLIWDPEEGYPKQQKSHTETLPHRLEFAGPGVGLSVDLLQNMSEWQFSCSGGLTGFKVIISSPGDNAVKGSVNIRIPTNVEMSLVILPKSIKTNKNLASVNPSIRNCFFSNEKHLQLYRYYTQSNCFIECYTSSVLSECNCVPFFSPRNSSVPYCLNPKQIECFLKVRDRSHDDGEARMNFMKCNCFPACSELMYLIDNTYYADLINENSSAPWIANRHRNMMDVQTSRLLVYYKEQQFYGIHRQTQSTIYDFLGTCGGLLGLFLGFSFISAFEVLYFLIIRPFSMYIHQQNKKTKDNIFHIKQASLQPFGYSGQMSHRGYRTIL